jgi:hypothetical protein
MLCRRRKEKFASQAILKFSRQPSACKHDISDISYVAVVFNLGYGKRSQGVHENNFRSK